LLLAALLCGNNSCAAEQTITNFVTANKLEKTPSFITVYKRNDSGRVFLEIPEHGSPDLLFYSTQTTGLGTREFMSSSGALPDRGAMGPRHLVAFRRYGGRVLLIERNTKYFTPASTLESLDDAGRSFPNAVFGSFPVQAQSGQNVLIDATGLFLRDGLEFPEMLRSADQGNYVIADDESAIDFSRVYTTENSIGFDVLISLSSDSPAGNILSRVAADRRKILVRERNTLVRLPDLKNARYRPRIFDPRSGFFAVTFQDPSRLPFQDSRQSFILRHMLTKKDAALEVSEPVKPIVYYVDPGVPKELRPLIAEAAGSWNKAFEAAGFKNAVEIKDLPPKADPFAPGVNVILWTPREVPDAHVGECTIDPRTGEILKAAIRLNGNLFYSNFFEAIEGPYRENANFAERDEIRRQSFRRLVAHEMGHTFGLAHHFAGSSQDSSSVMDYLFPKLTLQPASGIDEPRIGYEIVRGHDIGAWDNAAIYYGYHPFPAGQEASGLKARIEENERAGLYFLGQESIGDNPLVGLLDQGSDPVAELNKVLELRKIALKRFSKYAIPNDKPQAALREAFGPLYFMHRFQMRSVAAMLGGYTYRLALRDGDPPEPVPAERQRQALRALLETLNAADLTIDRSLVRLMAPSQQSYPDPPDNFRHFSGRTGRIFDALDPVANATMLTMDQFLDPERSARLAQARFVDDNALDLDEVLAEAVARTWKAALETGPSRQAQRTVASTVLRALLECVTSDRAVDVRGACWVAVAEIKKWIGTHPAEPDWADTYAFAAHAIARAERNNEDFDVPRQNFLKWP
jgi:hypothetical protein